MGWIINHIKPKAKGVSDDILNLQAFQSNRSFSKGILLVKASRHSKRNK